MRLRDFPQRVGPVFAKTMVLTRFEDHPLQPTILIVEDNPLLRDLYGEELEDEGYAVVMAEDEATALQRLQLADPDLMILDLHIPGTSEIGGLSLIDRVGASRPKMPIIVNSAYQFHEQASGVSAYVCKSGDLTELKTRVRENLSPVMVV